MWLFSARTVTVNKSVESALDCDPLSPHMKTLLTNLSFGLRHAHQHALHTLGGFENDGNCPATLPGSLWPHLTNPHDVFLLSALNAQDSLIRDF